MIMEKLREKWGRYEEVTPLTSWFPLSHLDAPTLLGSWSWSQRATKKRWIIEHGITEIDGMIFTHSDIALAYLDVKYPKLLRCNRAQYDACVKVKRHVPLYASRGVRVGHYVYMDMVSAYWQIIRRVGWDVEYSPGRYLAKRSDNSDFPYPQNKLARNSLVSIGITGRTLPMWDGNKLIYTTIKNRHANMILWATVQDVLNAIALEMITRAKAVYVHTDGYIIPADHVATAYQIAREWRINIAQKREGTYLAIKAVGNYKLSNYETKNYETVLPIREGIFHNVNVYHPDFIKNRFAKLGD